MTESTEAVFRKPSGDDTIPVFAGWLGSWQISLQRRAFTSSELARRYDRSAPKWDRTLDRLGVPSAYESMLRRVLRQERSGVLNRHARVLDCGVGTGALSVALARIATAPFALDAIDISPAMLERAGRTIRGNGVDVALREGDVRALPYEDDAFDLVMSAHVVEHLVDPAVAFSEMVRVLKPGGLLITCLTRRSLLGMLIHFKWRTHRLAKPEAERWLRNCRLQGVRCLRFDDGPMSRQLRLSCIGRKPHSVATEPIDTTTTRRSP